MKNELENFKKHVTLKYNIYNSIFQTLGLDGIYHTGITLPVFSDFCRQGLERGDDPYTIIERFFEERVEGANESIKRDMMFQFIQYIERQVVLVDALEDAAYNKINDMDGSGSFKSFYDTVANRNQLKALKEALGELKVRTVLTAHPTQFYPGAVLGIIKDLAAAMQANELDKIESLLAQLGYTPFFKKEKPTPFDEAVSLIWFLENIFYHSVPDIVKSISNLLDEDIDAMYEKSPLFQLGFWPGGDRDGNPFVTTDITIRVADRLRLSVLKCYYRDVRNLKRKLTFSKVENILEEIEGHLYESAFVKMGDTTFSGSWFEEKLNEIASLLESKYNGIYLNDVGLLKLKYKIFGLHFSTLDIRQNCDVVNKTFDFLQGSFTEKKHVTLGELLSIDTEVKVGDELTDDEIRDTYESFRAIRAIKEKNGDKGVHRYIISNCDSAELVARAHAIARMSGWKGPISLDFIPLFETVSDLEQAANIMDTLYSSAIYRKHVTFRDDKQVVMLGFSDGTKDGGYLTANWSIYKAKEEISAVSRRHGIKAIFFDGRGGPPARGGGNTHKFYASLGSSIDSNEIQLTIQGQTISSNYGTKDSSKFNLEQLLTAGLENLVFNDAEKQISKENRKIIEDLSVLSLEAYNNFKQHEKFVRYLEEISPLKYYNMANIGSRPAKRGKTDKLTLKDLRAIPFVGAWSQLKQNVPGFFGLGTAFKKYDEEGKLEQLKSLYKNSGFFKTLLENSMQSLCKTYFPLTKYLGDDKEFGPFWKLIHEEYKTTVYYLLKITGQGALLESNPGIRESISLREKIVLPLLTIQQYALMKIRKLEKEKAPAKELKVYENLVVRSLYGNINASRNSA